MNKVTEWLEKKGWHKYRTENNPLCIKTNFAKTFETPIRCACNSDKPGIQIVLEYRAYHPDNQCGPVEDCVELCLTGQTKNGRWVKIMSYALYAKDLKRVLSGECKRIVKCWEAANE